MANDMMTMTVDEISPGSGRAPGTIIGHSEGQPKQVKAFSDTLTKFQAGRTYSFSWYLGKPYNGAQDVLVSAHHPVTEAAAGARGAPDPSQAPHRAEAPGMAPAPQRQQNTPQSTPQGVMTGAAGTKDRSITVLAVMKSVIESGGSEEDFKRWLSLHDEVVHGLERHWKPDIS